MVCTKKILFRINGPFWARKWHIFITLDRQCVEVKINHGFVKALLRTCYVRLFECKGLSMLETVINCHVWNRGLQK